MGKYAWDAAFVAFCNGAPLAEISGVFHIPLESLKQHMAECNWRALRAKLPLVTNTTSEQNQALQKSEPHLPAVEARLTMRPPPRAIMPGMASCVTWRTPKTFVSKTSRNCSTV